MLADLRNERWHWICARPDYGLADTPHIEHRCLTIAQEINGLDTLIRPIVLDNSIVVIDSPMTPHDVEADVDDELSQLSRIADRAEISEELATLNRIVFRNVGHDDTDTELDD